MADIPARMVMTRCWPLMDARSAGESPGTGKPAECGDDAPSPVLARALETANPEPISPCLLER